MPVRDSIRQQPFRDSAASYLLNETDRRSLKNVENIYSNNNLGLNSAAVTADISLEVSDAVIFCDTTSAAITVTLQYANQWGTQKSPLIYIQKTNNANTVTISAQSGDTINGTASYILYAKESVVLATDGANTWYVFSGGDVASPLLTVPTVTITPGSAETQGLSGAQCAASFAAMYLPTVSTSTSTTLADHVNYTGSGVLQRVVAACESSAGTSTAANMNVKITLDGTVVYTDTSACAQDQIIAIVGSLFVSSNNTDVYFDSADDVPGIPFKTSCRIEFATNTAGQGVQIGSRLLKKT